MTPSRVLQVIDTTDHGGAQKVLLKYLENLRGEFTFAVAVLGKSGIYSRAYMDLGIPVYELGRSTSRWSSKPLLELVRVIHTWQPEIVHTHLFKSNVLGVLAAIISNRKSILHDHTGVYSRSMQYYRHYFPNQSIQDLFVLSHRLAVRYCSKVIVLTPEMGESYRRSYGVGLEKLYVLPNGVDLTPEVNREIHHTNGSLRNDLKISPEIKLILNAGRLEYEKGWTTYLEVAKELYNRKNPPCAFLIAGSGSEEGQLKEVVREQRLQNVFFLGYQKDVGSLLRQSDVFLSTSVREPFGLAILEAMASGCPVVATRSGGPESMIAHGISGFLADVGDVNGLAEKVISLLSDSALRESITRNAIKTVKEVFSLQEVSQQMAEIYANTLIH